MISVSCEFLRARIEIIGKALSFKAFSGLPFVCVTLFDAVQKGDLMSFVFCYIEVSEITEN
ncbi:hypothetical protein [Agrobacterium sp. NPDC090273]|uniref:hypothetical protein n=1 Tax=Agrobacterium sp. NPDC090273 TaxID=3363919 RepID=UPI00383A3A22